jgi:hypothetical protein
MQSPAYRQALPSNSTDWTYPPILPASFRIRRHPAVTRVKRVGGSLAKGPSLIFRILASYLTEVAAGVAGLLDVTAGFWVKPPASFPLLFIVVSVRMPVFPSLLAEPFIGAEAFDPAVAEGNGALDVDCPVFAGAGGCALGLPVDVAAF